MTRPCRLTVEYDGAAYHGWQVQANAPSVQEELEKAVARLAGAPARVRGAGRTDAGVHARGQTALAQVPRSIPVDRIPQALNTRLPDDIAVVAARETAADFDPRRHCVLKQYSYSIIPGLLRPALAAGRSWQVKWPVDVAAMAAAAAAFVGTHDFTSFCNREAAGGDTVRTVSRSEIRELAPDPAGRRRLVYYVEGRSFLYNMVRALTGTLVGVGTGRFRPGDMDAMLAARDRTAAGPSAPPWGLCLEWTLYEGEARPPDRDGLF